MYKKFRFTLRFLLGNLYDFELGSDAVDFEALPLADRYMLHRLWKLMTDVRASYDNYQFFRAYQACSLLLQNKPIFARRILRSFAILSAFQEIREWLARDSIVSKEVAALSSGISHLPCKKSLRDSKDASKGF